MSTETVTRIRPAQRDRTGDRLGPALELPIDGASIKWTGVKPYDDHGSRRRRTATVIFTKAVDIHDTDQLQIRGHVYTVLGCEETHWRYSPGVAGTKVYVEGVI